jgi:hypothetical protein
MYIAMRFVTILPPVTHSTYWESLVCDIKFFRELVDRFGVADFGQFRHIDVAFWFQLTVLATALFPRVFASICMKILRCPLQ